MIGFGFTFDWIKGDANFLNQSLNVGIQTKVYATLR